jgi:hypothetical protein
MTEAIFGKLNKKQNKCFLHQSLPKAARGFSIRATKLVQSLGTMYLGTMVGNTALVVNQLQREWDSAAHFLL